ncbi:hypothetical protein DYB32_010413 [Aphanomyces invadans]|uniref:Uncharacterized protein n=1 Tax=Aphanomyces invadans TaxID=157072 RepID=A0A418AG55_9STRA|nr:hypothetical protein DYB32_010413 [Aphanomyces invadans]
MQHYFSLLFKKKHPLTTKLLGKTTICHPDAIQSKSDIGYYRLTMAELQPVLDLLVTGTAAGGELFNAFEPLRRDSNRDFVGYVRIPTGAFTAQIYEGKILKVVLFDNHQANVGIALTDLMQLRKNMANQQLVPGLTSFRAIDTLTGISLKLPVKDRQKPFLVGSSHDMDGFHVDKLDFAHDSAGEAAPLGYLCCVCCEGAVGAYTQVSATLPLDVCHGRCAVSVSIEESTY